MLHIIEYQIYFLNWSSERRFRPKNFTYSFIQWYLNVIVLIVIYLMT